MPTPVDQAILGRWNIVATTLPFLADAHATDVTTEYFRDPGDRHGRLRNVVRWKRRGRQRSLKGWVRRDRDGSYHWRSSAFPLLQTAWSFSLSPADSRIGVIQFSATLLSTAGAHVVARDGVSLEGLRRRVHLDMSTHRLDRREFDMLAWRDS